MRRMVAPSAIVALLLVSCGDGASDQVAELELQVAEQEAQVTSPPIATTTVAKGAYVSPPDVTPPPPPPPPPPPRLAFEDHFDNGIDASVWEVANWVEHDGQTSSDRVYVQDGKLHLTFVNDPSVGYLSSAIQTRQEFLFGRWEARMKLSNVPGVCNAMYTIDWDDTAQPGSLSDGTKQEVDIEFLTKSFGPGYGQVHYAVHAAGLQSFQTNPDLDLGFDPSADFHVWGFDITPDHIEWFVDDKTLLTYRYSEHAVAVTEPYQLKFSHWTTSEWVGGPPAANTESIFEVDWVRFTPYGLLTLG